MLQRPRGSGEQIDDGAGEMAEPVDAKGMERLRHALNDDVHIVWSEHDREWVHGLVDLLRPTAQP